VKTIELDFETYYDTKGGLSVSTQGVHTYVRDPRFHVILVAAAGTGFKYSGPPEDFEWGLLDGAHVWAHNKWFDSVVYDLWVRKQPWFPGGIGPERWSCTAELSAWLGCRRDLAAASCHLLGEKIDKNPRAAASGVTRDEMQRDPAVWKEYSKYCMQDVTACGRLRREYADQWPEKEQRLSRLNYETGQRGCRIDVKLLHWSIDTLSTVQWEAEQQIPWDWSDNKTPLSLKKLAEQCRKEGIPVPKTTNKKDPECIEWLDTYGDRFPWVTAVHRWRAANVRVKRLETIRDRLRSDGTIPIELMYFGTHTGRFTGSGGMNAANLAKGETFGVDERKLFIPRKGYKFFISDLSQIEPRILGVQTGNWEFVDLCRTISPYQAHAMASMKWSGTDLKAEDPSLYALAKARVLALGYGAGYERFIEMVPIYIADPELRDSIFLKEYSNEDERLFIQFHEKQRSMRAKQQLLAYGHADDETRRRLVNSLLQVIDFRKSNPLIVEMWRMYQDALKQAARGDGTLEVEYPSGRSKIYTEIAAFKGELKGQTLLGGNREHLYGAKLTENTIQGIARDVFVEGYLNLYDLRRKNIDLWVPLHVYDEFVIEAPENSDPAPFTEAICREIPWIPELTIASDMNIVDCYTK